jgi:hypothetical protein
VIKLCPKIRVRLQDETLIPAIAIAHFGAVDNAAPNIA